MWKSGSAEVEEFTKHIFQDSISYILGAVEKAKDWVVSNILLTSLDRVAHTHNYGIS